MTILLVFNMSRAKEAALFLFSAKQIERENGQRHLTKNIDFSNAFLGSRVLKFLKAPLTSKGIAIHPLREFTNARKGNRIKNPKKVLGKSFRRRLYGKE